MKLDPVFYVKENKLYKIADNSPFETKNLLKINVKWSEVEIADEQYNEEQLASLREQLKNLESEGKFAVIVPQIDRTLETPEQLELFVNAFNHTARRIKDCVSVAGFELAPQLLKMGSAAVTQFRETLAIKHAQYVYFAAETTSKLTDDVVKY